MTASKPGVELGLAALERRPDRGHAGWRQDGIFMAYLFTAQVFLREKQEGVIETLLCAPLSLRVLWIGKVLGVAIPASILTYFSAVLIIIAGGIFTGYTLVPSAPVLFHIIVVVPLFMPRRPACWDSYSSSLA